MKDQEKKQALVTVFNVINRDGIVTGIPNIPGLKDAITCAGCEVKTKNGIPVGIGDYMTPEQRAEFRKLIGFKRKRRISQVPNNTITNEG